MNLHSTMFLLIRINVAPLEWVRGKFTFHYVSTYTAMKLDNMIEQKHLHSTMFLLIPIARKMIPGQSRFTFHYVSTYTWRNSLGRKPVYIFTFHYVSTYTRPQNTSCAMGIRIYIPLCFYLYPVWIEHDTGPGKFTFHYVSTYTHPDIRSNTFSRHLHSTMFLLIHSEAYEYCVENVNLHSTMFLLILRSGGTLALMQ